MYLISKAGGVKARVTLTLMDQGAAEAQHCTETMPALQYTAGESWGFSDFMSHYKLHAHPGYLAGDRLVLRAMVEVLPS